jgi:hypothetical protein
MSLEWAKLYLEGDRYGQGRATCMTGGPGTAIIQGSDACIKIVSTKSQSKGIKLI